MQQALSGFISVFNLADLDKIFLIMISQVGGSMLTFIVKAVTRGPNSDAESQVLLNYRIS